VLGAVALAVSLSVVIPSAGAKAAAAKVTAPRWIVVSVHYYGSRGNVRLDTQTGQAWQLSADQDGNFIWWPFTANRPLAAAKAPGVWQISWDSFNDNNPAMLYSNQTGETYTLELGSGRGSSNETAPKFVYMNSPQ
jgi:hypothetical protein